MGWVSLSDGQAFYIGCEPAGTTPEEYLVGRSLYNRLRIVLLWRMVTSTTDQPPRSERLSEPNTLKASDVSDDTILLLLTTRSRISNLSIEIFRIEILLKVLLSVSPATSPIEQPCQSLIGQAFRGSATASLTAKAACCNSSVSRMLDF